MEEKRLKIYFDSEFTGLHQQTTLVSIGLIAETGETFYAEFDNWDREALKDKWFAENVAAHLLYDAPFTVRGFPGDVRIMNNPMHITANLQYWFKVLVEGHEVEKIEFWSDTLAYDWVLFCELWGGALKVPDEIYYIPFDLSTLLWTKGIDPDISREEFAGLTSKAEKHNSLWDSRIIRSCYERLQSLQYVPGFPQYLADIEEGIIYSLKNGFTQLKLSDSKGYHTVTLYDEGRKFSTNVHRVMMAASLGTWDWDKPEVNHIDGNRSNNVISNLELATREEQMTSDVKEKLSRSAMGRKISEEHKAKLLLSNLGEKNNKAKLTDSEVGEILNTWEQRLWNTKSEFVSENSGKYQVCKSTIYRIIGRKSWKHL